MKIETYTKGRKFVHVDIEPTQIGRVLEPDFGIVSDAKAALELFVQVARERKAAGQWPSYADWAGRCAERKRSMLRQTHFEQIPMKPHRVYEEMNQVFGRDTVYVSTIGLSQIAGAQLLHVYGPRQWINCGQAGPLGWTMPAALGVVASDPTKNVVALSGDYDFQFMLEELAVGAQFRLPYVHVLVNNSYLGLIRQSQRGFDMDYCVQLAFDNQNMDEADGTLRGYGVDHQAVVEGLGCKALRVTDPEQLQGALRQAQQMAAQHRVPLRPVLHLEQAVVLEEADQGGGRIVADGGKRCRPDGGGLGDQVIVAERLAVALLHQIVVQRGERRLKAGQVLGARAVEAVDVPQHAPEPGREQVALLGEDRAAGVLEGAVVEGDAERHVGGLAGDAEVLQQGGEIGVVGRVVDDEAGVHRRHPPGVARLHRVGVAAQPAVGLEQGDGVLAPQHPGGGKAGDAAADDGDAERLIGAGRHGTSWGWYGAGTRCFGPWMQTPHPG